MKKLIITIIAGTILSAFTLISNTTWHADPTHTKVGFSITHLGLSEVDGYFKDVTATVTSSKDDFSDATVEFTAQTNSIFTDNTQRDEHLKGADFFDATKFGTITFNSTSMKKSKNGSYIVKGNLSMHGITKAITLNATSRVGVNPMSKKTTAGFRITGVIKRTDFNLGGTFPNAMLSDEVAITANTEFVKQ